MSRLFVGVERQFIFIYTQVFVFTLSFYSKPYNIIWYIAMSLLDWYTKCPFTVCQWLNSKSYRRLCRKIYSSTHRTSTFSCRMLILCNIYIYTLRRLDARPSLFLLHGPSWLRADPAVYTLRRLDAGPSLFLLHGPSWLRSSCRVGPLFARTSVHAFSEVSVKRLFVISWPVLLPGRLSLLLGVLHLFAPIGIVTGLICKSWPFPYQASSCHGDLTQVRHNNVTLSFHHHVGNRFWPCPII